MARATFVKKSQKTIYANGKRVNYVSKSGKRAGQTLSKLDKTIPENAKDPIVVAKGESYYWWQFKNRPKQFSKERPKASQLTQSNYLSQLYDIQDTLGSISAESVDDLVSAKDDIVSSLESLKEETEGSLENMPESLQSSPTGELLQERIDALDNAISELESIDLDDYEEPDEDEIKQELIDEGEEAPTEETIEERKQEKLREWLDEKIEEISGISLE